jgi:O-acetyl-ADP-ribose deacetylase (regulator of RNase III)
MSCLIHRLRAACRTIMQKQMQPEPTGRAKITKAFCLPSSHVIHTVGPIYPEVVCNHWLINVADNCLMK